MFSFWKKKKLSKKEMKKDIQKMEHEVEVLETVNYDFYQTDRLNHAKLEKDIKKKK